MQPTRRQVPPSSGSCSTQTIFAPSWAARIAAVYPPGPPPRTATSHSISHNLSVGSLLSMLTMSSRRPRRPTDQTPTKEHTMRKLVESTFMSLDGAIDNPQNWSPPYWDDEHAAYAQKLMSTADELLLGRKTYEGFAEAWPQRSGDPFTDKINAMPKHVATRTLTDLTWNAQPLQGDAVEAVAELKQRGRRRPAQVRHWRIHADAARERAARRAARLDLPRARRRRPAPDRRDRRHAPRTRRDDALRERHRRQSLRDRRASRALRPSSTPRRPRRRPRSRGARRASGPDCRARR